MGDLQAKRPLKVELQEILELTEVWFIRGNHDKDTDAEYDYLFSSALVDRNLYGRVVENGWYKIAGLGGVFVGEAWLPPSDPRFHSQDECARYGGKGN